MGDLARGKLVREVKERSEPVDETFYYFEDSEATPFMLLNGLEVKEFGTWCGIEYAIEEAKRVLERYSISEGSDITLVVKNHVYETKQKLVEPHNF